MNEDLMDLHVAALYRWHAGRMLENNQWDAGLAPRFHLTRSPLGVRTYFDSSIDNKTVAALQELAAEERFHVPDESPSHRSGYEALLAELKPIETVWEGPAYALTSPVAPPGNVELIDVTEANADCLEAYMLDWIPDVPHRRPFVAAIVDGKAAAVCASVRMSSAAHEAGVETSPAFRKRGLAIAVVAAWAERVRLTGAIPLYSTSWDNVASQAVAARLGAELIGTDFHIS